MHPALFVNDLEALRQRADEARKKGRCETAEKFAQAAKEPAKFTTEDAIALMRKAVSKPVNHMEVQIGGDHYKRMAIQPITYIHANNLGFFEGSVVKYVSRWQFKNGIEDLKKARDLLDKKIAMLEEKQREGKAIKAY